MKRICASSWTVAKNHCMMHGQQNVKSKIKSFNFIKDNNIKAVYCEVNEMSILYNQRDATCTMFFIIIISALHISGGFSAHHQELIKLYVQPWVLSCFLAVYR